MPRSPRPLTPRSAAAGPSPRGWWYAASSTRTIETVHSDLIDGPLAHSPSSLFAANSVWALCAAITHNLLRAAGTLAGGSLRVARGATLRRKIVDTPARFARPARKPMLHPPAHWPWQSQWMALWNNVFGVTTPLTDTA